MFSTTSQVLKKCSYNFHINYENSLWTLTKLFREACHTQEYDENGAKMFSHLENIFFLKGFLSIDLLGPKEMILSIAQ